MAADRRVGNELKETTFHLGTGFDISDDKSRIDLAVEYALIGDIEKNIFEERTIPLCVQHFRPGRVEAPPSQRRGLRQPFKMF